ncbi:MAG: hypothetical protein AB7I34_17220 [Rhizobiaceae bacterium]
MAVAETILFAYKVDLSGACKSHSIGNETMVAIDEEIHRLQARITRLEELLALLVRPIDDFHDHYWTGYRGGRNYLGRFDASVDHTRNLMIEIRDELLEHISRIDKKHHLDEQRSIELSNELHSWMAMTALGVDTSEVPRRRYFPIRFYLSHGTPKTVEQVTAAMRAFNEALGFEIVNELPAQKGSEIRNFLARTRDFLTGAEFKKRLEKAEKALELQGLDKPQSDVHGAQAKAAVELKAAAGDEDLFYYQSASTIFIRKRNNAGKFESFCLDLTPHQIIELEKNPAAIQDIIGFAAHNSFLAQRALASLSQESKEIPKERPDNSIGSSLTGRLTSDDTGPLLLPSPEKPHGKRHPKRPT